MSNHSIPPRVPYTFDRVIRILFTTVTLIAVVFLLDYLKGVLLPFLVACMIAYMLEPIVRWNMKWTHVKTRFIPVALTLIETCLVVAVFCMIFIPYLLAETSEMTSMIRHYATSKIQIPYMSASVHDFLRENIDFDQINKLLSQDEWKELLKRALTSSWSFLSSGVALLLGVIGWLIVILYVVFIMLDYERIMLSFRLLIPMRHRDWSYRVATDIKNAMNRYFRGQFLIASCVGVLFSIGFLIIGLPMAVIFGLFIGILNMVPYLQLISLPFTVLLCLVSAAGGADFWQMFWECMAVYVVVQCIQDLILTPKIMGKAMGLNPAIILLSLSIWGTLLGFMGLIIGLPLTTLLISYYDQYISSKNSPLESQTDKKCLL